MPRKSSGKKQAAAVTVTEAAAPLELPLELPLASVAAAPLVPLVPLVPDGSSADLCTICANHYTPVVRKKLTCPYCFANNCSQCLSTYLLGLIGDPACMHCRVGLNDTYLASALTKTFIKGPLFKLRQAILIQRTRIELPLLQDQAQRVKKQRENNAVLAPLLTQETGLRILVRAARSQMWAAERDVSRVYLRMSTEDVTTRPTPEAYQAAINVRENARNHFRSQSMTLRILQQEIRTRRRQLRRENGDEDEDEDEDEEAAGNEVAATKAEEKKFIRRCVRENCQGFLSTAWKCGLCEWYSCSTCFTPRGEKHDTPHECKKENIDTAELIKKDSKPCPKCGEFIYRSEGCAQIWCIVCHTAFDWNTGKIVTNGVIHNPHYYEWLKRNGGEMPRNPADVPCGGYPTAYQLISLSAMKGWMRYSLDDFHRLAMEVQDVSENSYRTYLDQHTLTDTNVKFLLGDIDEKKWGQRLASHEKRRKRDREVQDVFAAFRMVAVELINRIQNFRTVSGHSISTLPMDRIEGMIRDFAREAHALIEMINAAFQKIGETNGCRVPQFTPRMRRFHNFHSRHAEMMEPPSIDLTTLYGVTAETFELVGSRGKQERVCDSSDSEEDAPSAHSVPLVAAQAAPVRGGDEDEDEEDAAMEDEEAMEDDEAMDDIPLPEDHDDEVAQIQQAIANSLKMHHGGS